MAILIPSLNSCLSRMTSGEKRVARALENNLDDDYLLWYDVSIGEKRLHPDFIILHPDRGFFILEVKDWKLDNIQQINRTSVTLLIPEGIKEVNNPLRQSRNYALAVCKLLERDADLVFPLSSQYQGKLLFPYGYGVVLSNITRRNFEQSNLAQILEPHLVICKDEITESADALNFQQQIWDLSAYQFGKTLTLHKINRIRWHIFPELRIGTQLSLFPEPQLDSELDQPEVKPIEVAYDLIKIMDLQQEQLARSMGDGHRIIHGVAGSGKTLILVYRCQFLAEQYSKPILCLCFNVSLASKLRYAIAEKNLASTVKVRHFHGWCVDVLKAHKLELPDSRTLQGQAFIDDLVNRVIEGFNNGAIAPGQYGAVIIDEGHDFKPEWLKLTTKMVDRETNSLLVLYDDAQSIYEKKQRQNFSFKSVGIQAQGRTTILRLNYRNTVEVLTLAYEFAREVLAPSEATEDDTPVLVQPQSAGRRGKKPELIYLPSFMEEVRYLSERVQQLNERGTAWNDIAIIYRSKFMGERISQEFQRSHIPVEWVNANNSSRTYQPGINSIKLITMHSSKGLEFPVVFIPGLGYLPNQNENAADEARLMYVAMTRAIEQLVITYHQKSKFTEKLQLAVTYLHFLITGKCRLLKDSSMRT